MIWTFANKKLFCTFWSFWQHAYHANCNSIEKLPINFLAWTANEKKLVKLQGGRNGKLIHFFLVSTYISKHLSIFLVAAQRLDLQVFCLMDLQNLVGQKIVNFASVHQSRAWPMQDMHSLYCWLHINKNVYIQGVLH